MSMTQHVEDFLLPDRPIVVGAISALCTYRALITKTGPFLLYTFVYANTLRLFRKRRFALRINNEASCVIVCHRQLITCQINYFGLTYKSACVSWRNDGNMEECSSLVVSRHHSWLFTPTRASSTFGVLPIATQNDHGNSSWRKIRDSSQCCN